MSAPASLSRSGFPAQALGTRTVAILAGALLSAWLGCGGGAAGSATMATPTSSDPAPTLIGNTGFISQPALIGAGMAAVQASVPSQAGASWNWSLTGGSPVGPLHNAALGFNAGAGPSLRSQCSVTQNGQTTVYYQDSFVLPALVPAPRYYGSGYHGDALANTPVGGPGGTEVSYRFRAQASGPLQAVRVFFIWDAVKAGYNAGTGGQIRVDLLADDGSAQHLPTGAALATVSYGNILASDFYPLLRFAQPATLSAGSLYHLRFSNIDPSPASNYVSLDALYTDAQISPAQQVITDLDSALLMRGTGGSWTVRPGFSPIAEYHLASGSQGLGYMEVWSGNPKPISGQAMVRERFTVSSGPVSAGEVRVRLCRVSGSSPLTLRLEQADGTLVEAGTIPASSALSGAFWWVSYRFASPHTLAQGASYQLTLSSPADTVYSTFPYRKGSDKGFTGASLFLDGHAEFTRSGDSGWTGWDQWGQQNRSDADLQFLFVP